MWKFISSILYAAVEICRAAENIFEDKTTQ